MNNKGFQVERQQATGDSWETVGFVAAKGKSSTYTFTDVETSARFETSPTLITYYRLRQIDNDGKETLSKVVSISRSNSTKLKTYPNPVSNVLTVENTVQRTPNGEGDNYQILNLLGQQVKSGKAPFVSKDSFGGDWGLDVSALPQGSYVLKVGSEQVKFIKQ